MIGIVRYSYPELSAITLSTQYMSICIQETIKHYWCTKCMREKRMFVYNSMEILGRHINHRYSDALDMGNTLRYKSDHSFLRLNTHLHPTRFESDYLPHKNLFPGLAQGVLIKLVSFIDLRIKTTSLKKTTSNRLVLIKT